jgi:hypothetical protein
MANSKISALTSATTPLAGTEVLPIVQSSTTKQVSIANVTAGRVVDTAGITVTGYAGATAAIDVSGAGTLPARIRAVSTTTAGASIVLRDSNTTNNVTLLSSGQDLVVQTGGVQRVNFSGGGDVTALTGNIVQGTAAKGFNFTANTPAAGKTSQLLNWYEEGTWTPTDASGASLSFTNTSGNCYYTRNGNVVTCIFNVTYPATADVNSAQIGGFPFTAKSTTNNIAGGQLSFTNYGAFISMLVNTGGTGFYFYTSSGTTVTNATCSGKSFRGVITYMV